MPRKILILGDVHSSHLVKWINALDENGFDVHVFTLVQRNSETVLSSKVRIHYAGFSSKFKTYNNEGSFKKLLFLFVIPGLLKLINEIKPDIVHSHYASSYGFLGALTGFHPYYVSVWGSDIYSFPKKGSIHKRIIDFVFGKADMIFSTSRNMAKEISIYSTKTVNVVPFGIDTDYFKPRPVKKSLFSKENIVIGTIKNLEGFYGIDVLIRIFKKLTENNPGKSLKLMIGGSGALEKHLKQMVTELSLSQDVIFTGRIKFSEVVDYHNMIHIFSNLSFEESFGVSVLEASACGVPVIASDAGGLPEVIENNLTGFSIPLSDEKLIEMKFQELIDDPVKRKEMGTRGREFVCNKFKWENCVKLMTSFYNIPGAI